MKKIWIAILIMGWVVVSSAYPISSKVGKELMGRPRTQMKSHKVNPMWLSITNYGFLGSDDNYTLPSLEFPGGDSTEYLFWGGLWIGGLKPDRGQPGKVDTCVSVGVEGWAGWQYELWPGCEDKDTIIEERVVSDQDYIAFYADTVTDSSLVGTTHTPMGFKITQRTYAWNRPPVQDLIMGDFKIKNIGADTIRDVYVGFYVDADCGGSGSQHRNKASDDICGYWRWRNPADTLWPARTYDRSGNEITGRPKYQAPLEYIRQAWIANATKRGRTDIWPTPDVTGIRFVGTSRCDLPKHFQWWYSSADPSKDWGPHDPSDPLDPRGTPNTDPEKYRLLSLATWKPSYAVDPDQLDPVNGQYATYGDTRYLISYGPFPILYPGDSVRIAIGFVGGRGFQKQDDAYGWPYDSYYDFTGLANESSLAYQLYDPPGVDTDGDGYRGEWVITNGDTVWITGDCVPDYVVPPVGVQEKETGEKNVPLPLKVEFTKSGVRFLGQPEMQIFFYDLLGRKIKELVLTGGKGEISGLTSGVYFYRTTFGGRTFARKVVYIK